MVPKNRSSIIPMDTYTVKSKDLPGRFPPGKKPPCYYERVSYRASWQTELLGRVTYFPKCWWSSYKCIFLLTIITVIRIFGIILFPKKIGLSFPFRYCITDSRTSYVIPSNRASSSIPGARSEALEMISGRNQSENSNRRTGQILYI